MARELGLGITPWSPLKSGVLSGKYTRANAGGARPDRAAFMAAYLNETTYALIDELERIAAAHGSTVARVALATARYAIPGCRLDVGRALGFSVIHRRLRPAAGGVKMRRISTTSPWTR